MKKQYPVIILLAIIVFALCGVACSNTRLAAPSDVRIEADYLTWDSVAGADAYLVTINGENHVVKENKYDLLDETIDYTTYKMSVIAMSENPNNDSIPSKTLVYKPQPVNGILNYKTTKVGKKTGLEVSLKSGLSDEEIPEKIIIPSTYTAPGTDTSIVVISVGKMSNSKVKSIWIPSSVSRINAYAFSDCESLERIKLPTRGLTEINEGTFMDCAKLQEIELPKGLSTVNGSAFNGCASLREITFPDSLNTISDLNNGIFNGCPELKKIEVLQAETTTKDEDGNPKTEKVIGKYYTENGCLIETASKTLLKAVGSFTIPEDVTTLTRYALADNTSLVDYTIPEQIQVIPSGTFSGCINLKTIDLNQATTFDSKTYPVFADCNSLTSITFPKTTTSITGNPFRNCTSLVSVNVDPDCPGYIAINNFILKGNTLVCGLEAKNFPINAQIIDEYAYKYSSIEEAVIPSNMRLSDSAFAYCDKLNSLTLQNGITSIPSYAFYFCHNLENVVFPSSMAQINSYAFSGCFKLSVTIPKSISISEDTFYGVTVYAETAYSNVKKWNVIGLKFNEETYEITTLTNGSIFTNADIAKEGGKAYINSYTLKTSKDDPTLKMDGDDTYYNTKTLRAIPYREGYEFVGWKTSADSEVVYKPYTVTPDYENMTPYKACLTDDELQSIPNGTVLYAEWKKL